ncbi:MAG TPA: tRNA glutamyl-Q(34) synthetase GluQRS [Steroidobacteraceae bacterium]|nr:tRNA glutamyl-Q(34) synthetase GluQRS [Steroidobacteraceae bacterium]
MGRFAPTPSGALHLGSLYAAAASFLDARAHGGRWLVRIEDLDPPREVAGSAAGILRTLQAFGFEWDGEPVRQSRRTECYADALRKLSERGLTFQCSCSRLQLEDEIRYPGTCREHPAAITLPTATRLRVEPGRVMFCDRIQGIYSQDVAAAVGDLIIRRRDQWFAYLLAVVVDDAAQGITHVVRGADLLDNTPRQIYLQRVLGLPSPAYAHVPLLTEPNDVKLAKSRRSVPLHPPEALPQLLAVFTLLGLEPPASLAATTIAEAWRWAIDAWDIKRVPKALHVHVTN